MTPELKLELQRIRDLSNHFWSDFDYDTRVPDPNQLLAAVIHRLSPDYFNRPIQDRQPTSRLLDATKKESVEQLYQFVGSAPDNLISPLLKAHLLGECWGFLKHVGGYSEKELAHLDSIFDVGKAMADFWNVD
jgi:hypothetical protein